MDSKSLNDCKWNLIFKKKYIFSRKIFEKKTEKLEISRVAQFSLSQSLCVLMIE